MLDLGNISVAITPGTAKAFLIPVGKRPKPIKSGDVLGTSLKTKNVFTVPLRIFSGNHRPYNKADHTIEVRKTSGDYDALILAWYFEKNKASGTSTSSVHFRHSQSERYNHGQIHVEYSITYDNRIACNNNAIHICAIVMSNPSIAQKLLEHYDLFLLVFDPKASEKVSDNTGCDHLIKL